MITISVYKGMVCIHDQYDQYLILGEEYLHVPLEELLKIFESTILESKKQKGK
jgi:hypothetical protein